MPRTPASSEASRTTAPAPSPKSTQVARSVKSTCRVRASAPTTSARRARPLSIVETALCSANTKLVHAAITSTAGHDAPMACWMSAAVDGKMWSGLEVPTTIRSRSARADTRILERATCRCRSESRRGLALSGDAALPDARPRGDPLVGGVDHRLEVVVGEHLLRQIGADPGDRGVCHGASGPLRPAPRLRARRTSVSV